MGRVNTPDRFLAFKDAGGDTCDGSGASRYDHMLTNIAGRLEARKKHNLFFPPV